MEKVAFFVEGQTEQIFINRLTKEILGPQRTNIIQKKIKGGTTMPKQEIVRNESLSREPWYEILIYDCGADNRVKSEMLDNVENLREQGYSKIVGLRDLFPIPVDELEKLERGLRFMPRHFRNKVPYFNVIVAIHEVETWFLGEFNHYKKVDRKLTPEFIQKNLGFNPFRDDMTNREHPAEDLNQIYNLVGRSYTKKYSPTRRVINQLDYNHLIDGVSKRMKSLADLIWVLQDTRRRGRGGKR